MPSPKPLPGHPTRAGDYACLIIDRIHPVSSERGAVASEIRQLPYASAPPPPRTPSPYFAILLPSPRTVIPEAKQRLPFLVSPAKHYYFMKPRNSRPPSWRLQPLPACLCPCLAVGLAKYTGKWTMHERSTRPNQRVRLPRVRKEAGAAACSSTAEKRERMTEIIKPAGVKMSARRFLSAKNDGACTHLARVRREEVGSVRGAPSGWPRDRKSVV